MEIFPRSVFHKSGFLFKLKYRFMVCVYLYVFYMGKKCSEPMYLLTVISIAFHCIISTLIVSPYFPTFLFYISTALNQFKLKLTVGSMWLERTTELCIKLLIDWILMNRERIFFTIVIKLLFEFLKIIPLFTAYFR